MAGLSNVQKFSLTLCEASFHIYLIYVFVSEYFKGIF